MLTVIDVLTLEYIGERCVGALKRGGGDSFACERRSNKQTGVWQLTNLGVEGAERPLGFPDELAGPLTKLDLSRQWMRHEGVVTEVATSDRVVPRYWHQSTDRGVPKGFYLHF